MLFSSFISPVSSDFNNISASYLLVVIITVVFVYSMKLRVCVKNQGLSYQFFPIHLKQNLIKKEDIKYIELVKYNPVTDYGGWGI